MKTPFPRIKTSPDLSARIPTVSFLNLTTGKFATAGKKEHRAQRHGETNKRRDHLQLASDSVAPRPFRSTAPPREKEGRKEREQRTRDDREREREGSPEAV